MFVACITESQRYVNKVVLGISLKRAGDKNRHVLFVYET